VQLGEVVVRYAGPPVAEKPTAEQRIEEREEQLERERAAAAERKRLEEWSA
jgi:hypothetical protein